MQDFAAIDFETANNERSSVCSVGIVIDTDNAPSNLAFLGFRRSHIITNLNKLV